MSKDKEQDITKRLIDPSTRRKAFEDMVNYYSSRLYWQIRRMVTYHDDADDVLQNTFVKAWNGIENFRGDSKLSTWLFKIAYNESLTFLGKQHETISLDNSMDFDDESSNMMLNKLESDTYFDGDETMRMLQAAIAGLPAKQRSVFNMKYFDDMKYEEIAEVTGTSVGALKASYHLAVKKIEDFFNSHD
mgnify:FL=1